MPGIGFGELAVIFLLLLVFLGPKRLPQAARTFGRVMGEVRRATDELKTALYLEEARQRRTDPSRDPYRRSKPTPAPPPDTPTGGARVREVENPEAPDVSPAEPDPGAGPAGAADGEDSGAPDPDDGGEPS